VELPGECVQAVPPWRRVGEQPWGLLRGMGRWPHCSAREVWAGRLQQVSTQGVGSQSMLPGAGRGRDKVVWMKMMCYVSTFTLLC
jgi:hypothetical protein